MIQKFMSMEQSFLDAMPLLAMCLVLLIFIKGPFSKFFYRNFLDTGKDRYSESLDKKNSNEKKQNGDEKVTEEKLKFQIRQVLVNESGEAYFNKYKENIEKLIERKKEELTNHAISNVYTEKKIEEVITDSLIHTVETTAKRLIRDNEKYQALEQETVAKLDLIKISSFLQHLEKEYDATRSTKALMSNMFIMVNLFYFFGLLVFLALGKGVTNSPNIYLALSLSYIGFGSFVVYMIKFCNARSLTLLSLREDFLKRDQISKMAMQMIETGTSEHHVALLQLLNSSTTTKEQKINHPYEMLLYGIKDSNIMFKGGKFEIKKEPSIKNNS